MKPERVAVQTIAASTMEVKSLPQAAIHYYRYNRPPAIYTEGLVEDDGRCLRTYTVIPPGVSDRLAAAWISDGLLPQGTVLHALRKYHFYGEYFSIMQLFGPDGEVLGYYSDITTPLVKTEDGDYELRDLILDLWVFPDGQVRELDWDQFLLAERRGAIPHTLAVIARRTLKRLVDEAQAGHFPKAYLNQER